jgi:uncharacterized membrane protein
MGADADFVSGFNSRTSDFARTQQATEWQLELYFMFFMSLSLIPSPVFAGVALFSPQPESSASEPTITAIPKIKKLFFNALR